MSDTAFTPEPWEFAPISVRQEAPCHGVFSGQALIATNIREAADARLMAASRRLFEALTLCLPIIDAESSVGREVRAVLAKARGEQVSA